MSQTQRDEAIATLERELVEAETEKDVRLIKKKLRVLRSGK